MLLPSSKTLLTKRTQDIKETCRASASQRAALCRLQNQWIETGRSNGNRALVNKLYAHNDRLASHLFSPSELAFMVDFEAHYDTKTLAMAGTAARAITREWERKDIDVMFGSGVKSSLDYGSCVIKQMWGHTGVEARVIMPWQFGVYREDLNSLEEQEALCESGLMTTEEVWRRISHLPDAEKLYQRVVSNAGKESGEHLEGSFFHNVLSTSILNTDLNNVRQQPGGVVQLASNMARQMIGPEMKLALVPFHELYIKDDDREDYVTVLLIEPDILISPYFKRENMFAPKTQPYSLIQANQTPGYLWGRSEIVDLVEPQGLMASWYDDLKRMMALQNDKILAFSGADGISDEKYAEFRGAGFFDLPPGASVNDLTPQFPPQMFQAIETISRAMEEISGFSNILSGQGESGVRAGVHADTLMRAASPRLRDRSLLIERQCAAAADKTLSLMQAKDGGVYRTGTKEPVEFLLHDLPDDRRVTVDSHSSSPIFAEDHKDLVGFGLKAGYLGGDSAIDLLPYPQKDLLRERYAKMQEAKQKLIQEHPELLTKGAKGHH